MHRQKPPADTLALRRGRNNWQFGGEFVHLHVRDYSFTPLGMYYFHALTDFENNNPYKYSQTYGAADVRYGRSK